VPSKFDSNNLYPSLFDDFEFDATDTISQLNFLRQHVEKKAFEAIHWYLTRKTSQAQWSRFLRASAILLTTLGGLLPILQGMDNSMQYGQYGYISLALAAACIGLDKFFGFSSAWIRYMTTQMSLQRALAEFQMDWVLLWTEIQQQQPQIEEQKQLLQRIKEFHLQIVSETAQELQAWVSEFQSNLVQLEKAAAKAQLEAQRPGMLELTIPNATRSDDGLTILIDGLAVARTEGTKIQVGQITPGHHSIAIEGTVHGKPLETSAIVTISPGTVLKRTLELPIPHELAEVKQIS